MVNSLLLPSREGMTDTGREREEEREREREEE